MLNKRREKTWENREVRWLTISVHVTVTIFVEIYIYIYFSLRLFFKLFESPGIFLTH